MLPLQTAALPYGIVGILNSRVGQGRRAAVSKRCVNCRELFDKNRAGRAVKDDVVQRQKQNVLSCTESQQGCSKQRPGDEINGSLSLEVNNPLGSLFGVVLPGQVSHWHRNGK